MGYVGYMGYIWGVWGVWGYGCMVVWTCSTWYLGAYVWSEIIGVDIGKAGL